MDKRKIHLMWYGVDKVKLRLAMDDISNSIELDKFVNILLKASPSAIAFRMYFFEYLVDFGLKFKDVNDSPPAVIGKNQFRNIQVITYEYNVESINGTPVNLEHLNSAVYLFQLSEYFKTLEEGWAKVFDS